MDWLTAIVIGILQGTTEWLPVSSSGQSTLVLVDGLGLSAATAISLGLAIHIGTAGAVVAKYPKQLLRIANPMSRGASGRLAKNYWLVTILSLAIAFPLVLLLEETFESELWTGTTLTIFVGLALIATGLMLAASARNPKRRISGARRRDMLLLAIAQGVAVLPGISRSGMTVSTLLIRGYEKTASLQFSFILSVPVSLMASAYLLLFGEMADIKAGHFLLAVVFAFIFGYLTMEWLVRVSRRVNFSKFCIFFGLLAITIALVFALMG